MNEGNDIQRRFVGESSVLIKKEKLKDEVADLLEVGIATLYRWMRKKAIGESLKPGEKWLFYTKNRPGNARRVR